MRAHLTIAALLFGGSLGAVACSDDGGDDGAAACAETETTCTACKMCAATGPCAEILDQCQADADCRAFQSCVGDSDDEAHVAQCRKDNPGGVDLYCDGTQCSVYDECDALCEDSNVCPR